MGTTNDAEEDFVSLVPTDAATDDSEDFISLVPIDEENFERQSRGVDADDDATNDEAEKATRGKRPFDKLTGLPPWMDGYVDHRRVNPLVALHNEIVSFCKLMEPRSDEMKMREELVEKFTALAKSVFRDCDVDVFGSQATGYESKESTKNPVPVC